MVKNIYDYYLLNDVPDYFKYHKKLVKKVNTLRLKTQENYKSIEKQSNNSSFSSDDTLLFLLCLLVLNDD